MNYYKVSIILVVVLLLTLAGNFWFLQKDKIPRLSDINPFAIKSVSAEEIYPMFVCPCCGQPLDKKNICCGSAQEMIDYIDSLAVSNLSKDDIIMKTVQKYGITSVIESKRAEIEKEFAKINPDLVPTGKLSFNQSIGQKAPDFTVEGIDNKTFKLSDYRGKNVILFFNEGTMCYPACWDQILELGKDSELNNGDTASFSIVVDSKDAWQKIVKETPGFSDAKILFDTARAVSLAYDVLSLESSMHQGSFPGHTFFIIDKEGTIRYALDDPNMAIRNNALISEVAKLK